MKKGISEVNQNVTPTNTTKDEQQFQQIVEQVYKKKVNIHAFN